MFRLGDKKETNNPAALLEGEVGTFRVFSPSGDVSRYDCTPGHSIENIEFLGTTSPRAQYLIEKIAENVSSATLTVTNPKGRAAQAS